MANALVEVNATATLAGAPAALGRAAGLAGTIVRLVVEARLSRDSSAAAFARRAQRAACAILGRHGVRVSLRGPTPRGPVVIVANHVSYLDPLVISSIVPCITLAKGETRGWPLIGTGLASLGVVFVRRGDAQSGAQALRRAQRALLGGAAVLNFPEGTTSDGHDVGPFRRGVFGLARLAGVAVVPARITYLDARIPWCGGDAFVPHYFRLASAARVDARLSFGQPMTTGESDDPVELAARARATVRRLLDASFPS